MNPAHSPLTVTGAVSAVGEVCRSVKGEGVAVRFGAVKNRFLRRIQHFIELSSGSLLHHFQREVHVRRFLISVLASRPHLK